MPLKSESNNSYRADIQILRAIAVLLVVLYHAKVTIIKSGFLGVDIFFVISGFLIGGIIIRSIDNNDFSFRRFYQRRAYRLLPAAYVVFISVILISPFLLTEVEIRDLFWQVIGALTFTSNIVLWQQSGYFGGEASLKPLLHTWSLAIEEQFYIVLPLLLVTLKGRKRIAAIAVATLLSFTLAVLLRESASAAFYLLPTRAWELLLGVFVAIAAHHHGLIRTPRVLYFGSFVAVLIIPFFELTGFHPGPQAALLCVATAMILASQPSKVSIRGGRILLYFGAISYSLYLVHWPLFAFLNNVSFIVPWSNLHDSLVRIAIILIAFILAALLHRFVEEKFRAGTDVGGRVFLAAGVPLTALMALMVLVPIKTLSKDEVIFEACTTSGPFALENACQSGGFPRILVWGDSYAMHLIPGLADARSSIEVGVAHATRPACGPFIGVAQTKINGGYNQEWAESCIMFNDSVMEALSSSQTIEVVVLSSPFTYLMNNQEGLFNRNSEDDGIRWQPASFELSIQALSRTVEKLRSIGKRVVIVAPPPKGSFDMGQCGRRLVQGLLSVGAGRNCRFNRSGADPMVLDSSKLLAKISEQYNVDIIDLGDASCSSSTCESVVDGIPLYVDGGHLSSEGSAWIAAQMDLRKAVWELAR